MATKAKAKKPGPRYPNDVYAAMADKMYKLHVEPILKPRDKGKFVSIDVETGEFEMHRDAMIATDRLWERLGDPQPFLFRVGYRAASKSGYRKVVES